jgi:hypothetical protein
VLREGCGTLTEALTALLRCLLSAYRLVLALRYAGADFALYVVSYRGLRYRLCITQKLRYVIVFIGGSSGIRTLDTLRYASFQD